MQDTKNQQHATDILPHGRTLWYSSIIFLLFVFLLTIALFILTKKIQKSVVLVETEIGQIEKSIKSTNIDPNIVIAKIVQENNISSIDLKTIVTQFNRAAVKANVTFEGFSIKNNTITTTLISTVGNTLHSDPVATIISMMNDYGKNEGKEFRLGKITTISGSNTQRTTGIELTVLTASHN